MQKWKTDVNLYNCKRDKENKKVLDYYGTYVEEFLGKDEIKDWDSIHRCIELWEFSKQFIKTKKNWKVIDCGTKDGQFVEYLQSQDFKSVGIEIDDSFVKYAYSKGRNVLKGDICNIKSPDNFFNVSYAHHVLGLCPDYKQAYKEMLRVVKKNGYVITLNSVPGNLKKHFSYVETPDEVKEMLKDCPEHEVIYWDYWKPEKMPKEFVVILKKI